MDQNIDAVAFGGLVAFTYIADHVLGWLSDHFGTVKKSPKNRWRHDPYTGRRID